MPWAVRLDTSTFSLNNKGTRSVYEFTPQYSTGIKSVEVRMARHVGEAKPGFRTLSLLYGTDSSCSFESAGREEFNALGQQMCAD
jgi:hypothetical protein